jgi:hypothetical protein
MLHGLLLWVPASGATLNNSRARFIRRRVKFYVSAAGSDASIKSLRSHDIRAAKLNRA